MFDYMRLMLVSLVMTRGAAANQRGATLIEYALIISVIAVVVLVGGLTVTDNLETFFSNLGGSLDASGGGSDG